MRKLSLIACMLFLSSLLAAQNKRLWVLGSPGKAVEYDPVTFAEKQETEIPPEASSSPSNLLVNSVGQMLFAAPVALPLMEGDLSAERKIWFWNGSVASALSRDVARTTATAGSNLVITETAPAPFLSADGTHLYWFSNQARRLQRDGVDLSTKTTWLAWRTELSGANRQDLASVPLPECSCTTGGCEETCPYGDTWIPDEGVGKFFLLTLRIEGQTQPIYKSTSVYEETSDKWVPTPLDTPLQSLLDAADPGTILEAIPDKGCCGWSNESDDQTLLHLHSKRLIVFDELAAYKNPDYDVSFYTQNGKLSPNLGSVAITIFATAKPNTPIQLAEQGQANPQESQHIRKALVDLPAVEVRSAEDSPRRLAFVPHAALVGWINDKEILILEDHLLVTYNVASGTRRRSNIRVEDAAHVFLR
ncbi:MAG: hypothetical protein WB523_04415 [Candidatus Sulfotelmatobacter sp.]